MRDLARQVDAALMIPSPQYSGHSLDMQVLTTARFGELTPVFFQEAVPGGKYKISNETLVRMMPLVSPVMSKMEIKTHYYFVPYRLLWDNWQYFITGRKDPLTGLDPVHPYFKRSWLTKNAANNTTEPRLCDRFGFKHATPVVGQPVPDEQFYSPFALAAYQMIYNFYYRHKAIKEEVKYKLGDGLMDETDFASIYAFMRNITFMPDYFNESLPSPQLGGPAFVDVDAQIYSSGGDVTLSVDPSDIDILGRVPNPNDNAQENSLYANVKILSEEIRRAEALQKFLELSNHVRDYKDYMKGMYNVTLPDERARIPEFLCGFSQPIIASDVVNTADNFQGRLTSNASGYGVSDQSDFYAYEAGIIVGVAAVTYRSIYTKAIPKMYLKTGRFDYFNPLFDHLGEQEVKKGELIANHLNPSETFGYVPRHHEYRSSFDMTTGEMATTLAHWHLGRDYGDAVLTEDFFDVLDERRIFAFTDPNYDPIVMQVYNNVIAYLPMGQVAQPTI